MSGHEKNKIPADTIKSIIAEVKAGARKTDVARKYGIHPSTIYHYFSFLPSNKPQRQKLTIEQRENLKKDILKNEPLESLAKKYGVAISSVHYYKHYGSLSNAKPKAKMYSDLLKIENAKRKAKGHYQFKTMIFAGKKRKYRV